MLAGSEELWQTFHRTRNDGRGTTLQSCRNFTCYMFVVLSILGQVGFGLAAAKDTSGSENWRRIDETVIYRSNAPTKVIVIGNSVIVPVTFVYEGTQVDAQLLLDTGASGTVINTDIADRLHINLNAAKGMRGRVVGGDVIEGFQITVNRLMVGPHTKENARVFVIPHKGPAARYDGLLGMDVLRGLKYTVDFEKQLIVWE